MSGRKPQPDGLLKFIDCRSFAYMCAYAPASKADRTYSLSACIVTTITFILGQLFFNWAAASKPFQERHGYVEYHDVRLQLFRRIH